MKEFKYLGKDMTKPSKELDTFPKPDGVTLIRFESKELSSLCPITGQPDFNTLIIEYEPDELCVESKSLKLYLWTFREERVFGEGLASQIAKDIYDATSSKWCKVTIIQSVRGGLQLTAIAQFPIGTNAEQ